MKLCVFCGNPFNELDWQCPACGRKPASTNGHPVFAPELAHSNETFDIKLFSQLAAIEPNNFWHRSRNSLLIWAFQKYFPEAKNFLEIGCGTGFVLHGFQNAMPRLKLSGSEIYSEGLSYAKQRVPQADLFQMDARRIPFSEEFDVIGAFDIIEHVEEDEQILRQMHSALKNNGGILLTVPQHPFLWSQYDERAHHVRRYGASELKQKVLSAGFKILNMTSFVSFLLPAMMLSRFIYKKPDESYGVMTELHQKGVLNKILERILDFERFFIRKGVRFPAGGSLLVAAKKI